MPRLKPLLRNVCIALLALILGGCDLCDCLCHKKKDTEWAAVNETRPGSDGGTSGGGGTGGGGGGGTAVPEINPRAAVAGLALLGGLAMILVDGRRVGRGTAPAVRP